MNEMNGHELQETEENIVEPGMNDIVEEVEGIEGIMIEDPAEVIEIIEAAKETPIEKNTSTDASAGSTGSTPEEKAAKAAAIAEAKAKAKAEKAEARAKAKAEKEAAKAAAKAEKEAAREATREAAIAAAAAAKEAGTEPPASVVTDRGLKGQRALELLESGLNRREVVDALAEEGISVRFQYVYQIDRKRLEAIGLTARDNPTVRAPREGSVTPAEPSEPANQTVELVESAAITTAEVTDQLAPVEQVEGELLEDVIMADDSGTVTGIN